MDLLEQEPSYAEFAYNNTYGIQAIDQNSYQTAIDNFNRPETGCRDQIIRCQTLAARYDPLAMGANQTVNKICSAASQYCEDEVEGQYDVNSDRDYKDIVVRGPNPFPSPYYLGFLSQHWVQAALGVPANYTQSRHDTYTALSNTPRAKGGDFARIDIRGGQLEDIASLLDQGVKVNLIFGDRDYGCNCILPLGSSCLSFPFLPLPTHAPVLTPNPKGSAVKKPP